MRELKFKAIEAKTGEWVYGGITSPLHSPNGKIQIVSCEYHEQHEDEEDFIFIDVLPETVCQSTGRYDWTGAEIFEGDILDIEDETVVVVWDSMTAGFSSVPEIKYAERGWDETLTDHADCIEVTGNIHDK